MSKFQDITFPKYTRSSPSSFFSIEREKGRVHTFQLVSINYNLKMCKQFELNENSIIKVCIK